MTKQKTPSLRAAIAAAVFTAAALCTTATTARADAIPLVDLPNDPTYSWTWADNLTLGYSFSVTGSLSFNALGVFDVGPSAIPGTGGGDLTSTNHTNLSGLNAAHEVAVWDSAGTVVASATVDPTDPLTLSGSSYGQWVYHTIAPVTLAAGTYTIGAFYSVNSDPVMVRQDPFVMAPHVAPNVTYLGGRYLYANSLGRPTGAYLPNEAQYAGPTMLQVPDGGMTLTLLGGALAGVALLRRRRLR